MTVSTEFIGKGRTKTVHFKGKSTDDKSESDIWLREDESTFWEVDTGRTFVWGGVSTGWLSVTDPVQVEAALVTARANNTSLLVRLSLEETKSAALEVANADLEARVQTLEGR